jgi:hypothetical protein
MQTNPRQTPEKVAFYYPDDDGPYKQSIISNRSLSEDSKLL